MESIRCKGDVVVFVSPEENVEHIAIRLFITNGVGRGRYPLGYVGQGFRLHVFRVHSAYVVDRVAVRFLVRLTSRGCQRSKQPYANGQDDTALAVMVVMEQHTDDLKGVKVKKVVELSIMRLKKNACRRLFMYSSCSVLILGHMLSRGTANVAISTVRRRLKGRNINIRKVKLASLGFKLAVNFHTDRIKRICYRETCRIKCKGSSDQVGTGVG